LLGSDDLHTAQSHPTMGTPVEVPVPRKVTFTKEIRYRGTLTEVLHLESPAAA
jgi:hypothetical protein